LNSNRLPSIEEVRAVVEKAGREESEESAEGGGGVGMAREGSATKTEGTEEVGTV